MIQASQISVLVSDPWEFCTKCNGGPFIGNIIDNSNQKILIQFPKPFAYDNMMLNAALVSCRHGMNTLNNVGGAPIPVNIIFISGKVDSVVDAMHMSKERWIATIGSASQVAK